MIGTCAGLLRGHANCNTTEQKVTRHKGEENYRCRVTGHGDCNEAQPREVEDVEALIAHDEEIEEIHRSIAGRDGENFDHVVVVLENTRYYDTTGCEES